MKQRKLKAVFYARVSTEEEAQLRALPKQVDECKDVIKAMGWELYDSFIDEGKSGTKVKGRDEYQRLVDSLEAGEYDIVVIKSQDRLQRNPMDWYIFADKLNKSGKRLYMYLDSKFYEPTEDGLITGIKAILAGEYSVDLSKKINNANKRRIEKAKDGGKLSTYSNGLCYGYDMVNGELEINKKEAEIVSLIFKLYLEGNGAKLICKELEARGILNQRGRSWQPTTITNILKNERYKGNQVCNKTHYDFNKKKVIKNPPEEWIRFVGVVPKIVSVEDWDKAEAIRLKRVVDHGIDKQGKTKLQGRKQGKHPLSGKIFCNDCGKVFWRYFRADGSEAPSWKCSCYMAHGRKTKKDGSTNPKGCDMRTIKEEDLYSQIKKAREGFLEVGTRESITKSIKTQLEAELKAVTGGKDPSSLERELSKLEDMSSKLLDKYLEGVIPESAYSSKAEELEARKKAVKLQLQDLAKSNELEDQIRQNIKDLDKIVDKIMEQTTTEDRFLEFVIEQDTTITVAKEGLILNIPSVDQSLLWVDSMASWIKASVQEDLIPQLVESDRQQLVLTEDGKLSLQISITG